MTLACIGDTAGADKYIKEADVRPLDTLHSAVVLASARAAIELITRIPGRRSKNWKAHFPTTFANFRTDKHFTFVAWHICLRTDNYRALRIFDCIGDASGGLGLAEAKHRHEPAQ
jgi:hypothetical protein